jgi:crossover junction endodeoxyribonuclease RuvC
MRVLGIDCGTEITGYGVIDSDGREHRIVDAGVLRTNPAEPLAARLAVLAGGLRAVLREHRPGEAAVEEVFHAVNVKSALKLAHARGVALLVVAEAGLVCGEYSALEIKESEVGYGRAEKRQVAYMVGSLLGPQAPDSADACDALAVAICHATRRSTAMRLAEAAR